MTLLKPDSGEDLNPVSKPIHGVLKDLSPAGAQVVIAKNDISLAAIVKNLPIYTQLYFTLPINPKELQVVGKIVKIENAFRNIFLGIQFILKTFAFAIGMLHAARHGDDAVVREHVAVEGIEGGIVDVGDQHALA